MSSPITATIDPEKLRAILSTFPTKRSFRVFITAHSNGVKLVHETCWVVPKWIGERGLCEAYFWRAGKGPEAEGAWHFLFYPSLLQQTIFEVVVQYEVFIKRICSNKKMCILRIK